MIDLADMHDRDVLAYVFAAAERALRTVDQFDDAHEAYRDGEKYGLDDSEILAALCRYRDTVTEELAECERCTEELERRGKARRIARGHGNPTREDRALEDTVIRAVEALTAVRIEWISIRADLERLTQTQEAPTTAQE